LRQEHRPQPASAPASGWPGDARLVISISMQFEAGGQPPRERTARSRKWTSRPACRRLHRQHLVRLRLPRRHPAPAGFVGQAWRQGDVAHDRRGGAPPSGAGARDRARGHEAAAHGPRWSSQYAMSRAEERKFLIDGTRMVEEVTGQRHRLQRQLAAPRPEHAVAAAGAGLHLSHR
jgi:hypothetical protein